MRMFFFVNSGYTPCIAKFCQDLTYFRSYSMLHIVSNIRLKYVLQRLKNQLLTSMISYKHIFPIVTIIHVACTTIFNRLKSWKGGGGGGSHI